MELSPVAGFYNETGMVSSASSAVIADTGQEASHAIQTTAHSLSTAIVSKGVVNPVSGHTATQSPQ